MKFFRWPHGHGWEICDTRYSGVRVSEFQHKVAQVMMPNFLCLAKGIEGLIKHRTDAPDYEIRGQRKARKKKRREEKQKKAASSVQLLFGLVVMALGLSPLCSDIKQEEFFSVTSRICFQMPRPRMMKTETQWSNFS